MPLLLHSLNELRVLLTRVSYFKMVTPQRTLPAEIFYRNLERGVRVRAEKIRQNIPEKMDQEKFYAIKERARSCYKQKQLDHL